MNRKERIPFKHSDGINKPIGFNAVAITPLTADEYVAKESEHIFKGHPKREKLLREVHAKAVAETAKHEGKSAPKEEPKPGKAKPPVTTEPGK